MGAPVNACVPLTGAFAGSLVLVDRGDCEFVEKARNVQVL